MKVYRKKYGIKRVKIVGIRKVYVNIESNAALAWELDGKGCSNECK